MLPASDDAKTFNIFSYDHGDADAAASAEFRQPPAARPHDGIDFGQRQTPSPARSRLAPHRHDGEAQHIAEQFADDDEARAQATSMRAAVAAQRAAETRAARCRDARSARQVRRREVRAHSRHYRRNHSYFSCAAFDMMIREQEMPMSGMPFALIEIPCRILLDIFHFTP